MLRSAQIDNIMHTHNLPSLHSAISLFARNRISGANPHRDDYTRESLPLEFKYIDVWHHVRFHRQALNDFCKPDAHMVRCKPPDSKKNGRIVFDPIFVNVTAHGDTTASKWARIPEL